MVLSGSDTGRWLLHNFYRLIRDLFYSLCKQVELTKWDPHLRWKCWRCDSIFALPVKKALLMRWFTCRVWTAIHVAGSAYPPMSAQSPGGSAASGASNATGEWCRKENESRARWGCVIECLIGTLWMSFLISADVSLEQCESEAALQMCGGSCQACCCSGSLAVIS